MRGVGGVEGPVARAVVGRVEGGAGRVIDAGSASAGSTQARSAAEGPKPQYSSTIAVEVGLHHAAPPPPYCGYSPRGRSARTAAPRARPRRLRRERSTSPRGRHGVGGDRGEQAHRGPCPRPRSSVSRSRYADEARRRPKRVGGDAAERIFLAGNRRPRERVVGERPPAEAIPTGLAPGGVRAWSSTSTSEPGGVSAFQEGITSWISNPGSTHGPVHVAGRELLRHGEAVERERPGSGFNASPAGWAERQLRPPPPKSDSSSRKTLKTSRKIEAASNGAAWIWSARRSRWKSYIV